MTSSWLFFFSSLLACEHEVCKTYWFVVWYLMSIEPWLNCIIVFNILHTCFFFLWIQICYLCINIPECHISTEGLLFFLTFFIHIICRGHVQYACTQWSQGRGMPFLLQNALTLSISAASHLMLNTGTRFALSAGQNGRRFLSRVLLPMSPMTCLESTE